MTTSLDSFKSRRTFSAGGRTYAYFSLAAAEKGGLKGLGIRESGAPSPLRGEGVQRRAHMPIFAKPKVCMPSTAGERSALGAG